MCQPNIDTYTAVQNHLNTQLFQCAGGPSNMQLCRHVERSLCASSSKQQLLNHPWPWRVGSCVTISSLRKSSGNVTHLGLSVLSRTNHACAIVLQIGHGQPLPHIHRAEQLAALEMITIHQTATVAILRICSSSNYSRLLEFVRRAITMNRHDIY